jgi:GTP-binding protein
VERTRVLLHLVDLSDTLSPALDRVETILRELERYGAGLAEKPMILVGSKADLPCDAQEEEALRDWARGRDTAYIRISAAAHEGLDELVRLVWGRVAGSREDSGEEEEP